MRKRFVSVFIIGTMACIIFGCTNTAEDTSVAKQACTGMHNTSHAENAEQAADIPMSQEEPESEEEMEYDYFNTYLPILEEYERAWEDETYTIEDLQNVAGVFITLTDAKFRLETKEKDYTLYYSMSDLNGDGTEELIIGIQGEDEIAPCFLYTGDGERIHMTDSRTWSDLVEKPTMLYENEIVESTEYVKYGMYRYNFYQLSSLYSMSEGIGTMDLIDCYFYIEDSENGTQYYQGDMENTVTEEEFWSAINEYETLPQTELNWHELEGFWEPDKDDEKTIVIRGEHKQSEKSEEPEDKAESKKEKPVTVVAKETSYNSDGNIWEKSEYEYDSAGNKVMCIRYYDDGSVAYWDEYEYDSTGNEVKSIRYLDDGRVANWDESKYDDTGSKVMWIKYKADGSIDNWYGWERDSTGNMVKDIWFRPNGRVDKWSEWEYDSEGKLVRETFDSGSTLSEYEYDGAGNQTKIVYKKSNGDISTWHECEYDSTGKLIKQTSYYADGSITHISEYEYDNAGNETKWIGYYGDGGVEWWHEYEYEYDNTGNLTRKIDYEPDGRTEYEYITITPQ